MSKKDRLRRKKRKNLKAGGLNPPADLSFALTGTEETAADTIPAETEPADMGPAVHVCIIVVVTRRHVLEQGDWENNSSLPFIFG